MKLSREQVLHVAMLARLELSEEEIETFSRQLSEILGYVELLEQVDVAAVEPTFHVIRDATPLRPDEVHPGLEPEDALRNAPARSGTSFSVPKVIEA